MRREQGESRRCEEKEGRDEATRGGGRRKKRDDKRREWGEKGADEGEAGDVRDVTGEESREEEGVDT